jgi:hypothetical protein
LLDFIQLFESRLLEASVKTNFPALRVFAVDVQLVSFRRSPVRPVEVLYVPLPFPQHEVILAQRFSSENRPLAERINVFSNTEDLLSLVSIMAK